MICTKKNQVSASAVTIYRLITRLSATSPHCISFSSSSSACNEMNFSLIWLCNLPQNFWMNLIASNPETVFSSIFKIAVSNSSHASMRLTSIHGSNSLDKDELIRLYILTQNIVSLCLNPDKMTSDKSGWCRAHYCTHLKRAHRNALTIANIWIENHSNINDSWNVYRLLILSTHRWKEWIIERYNLKNLKY